MSNRGRTLFGVTVVGGALLYLAGTGIGGNLVYFLTPTELIAKGDSALGVPFRLAGQVVPGSVQWKAESLDLRFQISDGTTTVEVTSTGVPPQMFHEGIEVVVEGALAAGGVFQSHNIMVKHSNEYGPGKGVDHPDESFKALLEKGGS